MRGANFVSFLTVQGFFIGIVFALLKSQTPEDIIIYIALITSFFYMFSHFAVALFFRTIEAEAAFFPKDIHEHQLDLFVQEITKRELFIDETQETYKFIKELKEDEAKIVASLLNNSTKESS